MLRACAFILLAAALAAALLPDRLPVPEAERPSHTVAAARQPIYAEVQQSQPIPTEGLVLRRQADGHFYADAEINGVTVRMLVDTGASGIALSRDDARRAGIGISIGMPEVVGQGAGGAVRGEYVVLDRIRLGPQQSEREPAVVLDGGGQSLLGQSFLSRFRSVEIRGDRMQLR